MGRAKIDLGGSEGCKDPPLNGLVLHGVLKGRIDGQWGGVGQGDAKTPPPLKVCYCVES